MAKHLVQQGECLYTIACRYGFGTWQDVWNAPGNDALRKARKNPNVLLPGDIVEIPDDRAKRVALPTGQQHKIEITLPQARLKVRLVDMQGKAFAQEHYVLEVGGGRYEGETGQDGSVEQDLTADAASAALTLTRINRVFRLEVGHLDPASELSGAQARLFALAIARTPGSGQDDADFRAALRAFQESVDMAPTGNLDQATIDKLETAFGC